MKDGTRKMKLFRYLIYALIGLCVGLANADSFRITLENDTLSFPKKDSEYTHGTELAYMRDEPLLFFDEWGIEVEQTMYGPKLDNTDNMKQGEHPYCGYLSFNLLGNQWFDLSWADLSLQHSFSFGGVGPHSYSEQSQKYIHRWLGCKDPKGWKKWQVRDEFIFQYEMYANLNIKAIDADPFALYVIPRIGVDAGGFKDMVATGVDLKFGFNVPENIGSGMILAAPQKKQRSDWSAFALVGVEGRCVLHDTSIEGGFFRDSPYTLDAETWVGEFHWGVGVSYRAFEISYFNFIRSKEFATNNRNPNYGQITIVFSF